MKIAAIALATTVLVPLTLLGQMRDNRDKELACQDYNYPGSWRFNRFEAHRCDIREQTVPATGRVTVDPGRNGGVTVKGWTRNDVLVRSRIDVWARRDSNAAMLLNEVHIDTSNGSVTASGPSNWDDEGWSVSYEIFVPRKTGVEARAVNGGLSVSDVDGTIHLETTNGGINLARVAGDVSGETRNGGVNVELEGNTWRGKQLEVETKNGGVSVSVPSNYSARVQAETVNGRLSSDIPVTVQGWLRRQSLDGTIGSGGPLIHVSTINGGVVLRRS